MSNRKHPNPYKLIKQLKAQIEGLQDELMSRDEEISKLRRLNELQQQTLLDLTQEIDTPIKESRNGSHH